MRARALKPGDEAVVDRFLNRHAETSMFLRSNMAQAGLAYEGRPFQCEYFGVYDGKGELCGVLAHAWNGNIMVQAPGDSAVASLVMAFRTSVTRPIAGFSGPDVQVRAVIRKLGLADAAFALNRAEGLYVLALSELVMPVWRHIDAANITGAGDLPRTTLSAWLKAYDIEALHASDSKRLDQRVVQRTEMMAISPHAWALWTGDSPVALCGFNASLPDIVQLGPVWTPPEHRGRGYARYLVAGVLAGVRETGVRKATLFTDDPAALKAYAAIGFQQTGSYRLALLENPITLCR